MIKIKRLIYETNDNIKQLIKMATTGEEFYYRELNCVATAELNGFQENDIANIEQILNLKNTDKAYKIPFFLFDDDPQEFANPPFTERWRLELGLKDNSKEAPVIFITIKNAPLILQSDIKGSNAEAKCGACNIL